jgi:hypothetical protein
MVKIPASVVAMPARHEPAGDSIAFTSDPAIWSFDVALTMLSRFRLGNHRTRMTAQVSTKSLKFPAI